MTQKILFLISYLVASVALAESSTLLTCSTDGFGLAKMTIEKEEHTQQAAIVIQMEELDDGDVGNPPYKFQIVSGLKDLQIDTSATLVAQKDGQGKSGGTYEDAALLRVVDGKKRAFLAVHGNVFILHCY